MMSPRSEFPARRTVMAARPNSSRPLKSRLLLTTAVAVPLLLAGGSAMGQVADLPTSISTTDVTGSTTGYKTTAATTVSGTSSIDGDTGTTNDFLNIDHALEVTGGTLDMKSNDITVSASAGAFTISGGAVSDIEALVNAGTVTVSNASTFAAASVDNTATFNYTSTGTSTVSGDFENSGAIDQDAGTLGITGNFTQNGTNATTDLATTSILTADTLTNTGGTFSTAGTVTAPTISNADVFNVTAGTVTASTAFNNTAGTTTVSGTAELETATYANDGGTTTISATASGLDADNITNASGAIFNASGVVDASTKITNSGTFNVTTGGDVDATSFDNLLDLNLDAGDFNVTGTFLQNDAAATTDIAADSAFTTNDLTNTSGAFTTAGTTTVTGAIDNDGTFTVTAGTVAADSMTNDLTAALNGGILDVAGAYTNAAGTTDIAAGAELEADGLITVSGGSLTNAGTVDANAGITLSGGGTLTNTGLIALADGQTITGDLAGDGGTVALEGAGTISGNVTGTQTFNLVDGSNDDTLTISGTVADGQTFQLEFGDTTTDSVIFENATTGTGHTIELTSLGTDLTIATPTNIITTTSGTATLSADDFTIAPGAVIGELTVDTDGDLQVETQINPGVSALAGNLGFAQVLGAAIGNDGKGNIPYRDCGKEDYNGLELSARVSHNGFNKSADGDFDGRYSNFTVGAGTDCLFLGESAWKAALGVEGGFTNLAGETDLTNPIDDSSLGSLRSDGTTISGGLNGELSNGVVTIDQGLRFDFGTATINSPAMGLADVEQTQSAVAYSGGLAVKLGAAESGVSFKPRLGYTLAFQSADDVLFNSGAGGTLSMDDQMSIIGELGASIQSDFSRGTGVSTVAFLNGGVKHDFGGERESTFTLGTATEKFKHEGLGTFGDVEAGLRMGGDIDGDILNHALVEVSANSQLGGNFMSFGMAAKLKLGF